MEKDDFGNAMSHIVCNTCMQSHAGLVVVIAISLLQRQCIIDFVWLQMPPLPPYSSSDCGKRANHSGDARHAPISQMIHELHACFKAVRAAGCCGDHASGTVII